ncbi:MAG: restriction endonuclease subunit S [Nitrosotalea sp.]
MIVDGLFEVFYGTDLELNQLKKTENGVNFVSRTEKNNGVSAIVEPLKDVTPLDAGLITVALGGSVLSTFIQIKPFYSGRDLICLKPRKPMTLREKLFYCMCIRANQYRYSYGRQANRTLKFLKIPDKVPSWVYSKELLQTIREKMKSDLGTS